MGVDRHQARILAMQALCQWDVQGEEAPEALQGFLDAQGAEASSAACAAELVQTYWSRRQGVDDRISAAAENWELGRISPVERNVMRIAIVELLTEAVPAKVALDEAIEIGREYGGAESPRFINGVLDVVYKRLSRKKAGES